MMKTMFMKVMALFTLLLGLVAYACSGEDVFEDDDVRSLAKRAMQTRGENQNGDGGSDSDTVYKMIAGEASGLSNCGQFNVLVKWGDGNLTRGSGPNLTVTASPKSMICRSVSAHGQWNCSSSSWVHVSGSISYEEAQIVYHRNIYGHIISVDTIWQRGSTNFDVDINSSNYYVVDNQW